MDHRAVRVKAPRIDCPCALSPLTGLPLAGRRGIELSMDGMRDFGPTQVAALLRLHSFLAVRGKRLTLVDVPPIVRAELHRLGLAVLFLAAA
ncbi:MAG: hypothetical protein H6704_19695 [Myxococcales bacterium]|nr:hypothetical protein [Myxococcales bacterium]MCB9538481.1 hypothetical protein [Myxococcales bacterium]